MSLMSIATKQVFSNKAKTSFLRCFSHNFGTATLLNPEIKSVTISGTMNRGQQTKTFNDTYVALDNLKLQDCQTVLKDEVIAVIGNGPQGYGQGENLRDSGYNVIRGVRWDGPSWNKAVKDGWIPGKNLFDIEEAASKGSIIQYLLSDEAQKSCWSLIAPHLNENDTLYFSHGLNYVFVDEIQAPDNVDVVMIAPKGPGFLVRENYLLGNKGINASFAVEQDSSGKALEKVYALAYGIGSKNLFETTFKKEVYSDLFGESCVLMGMKAAAYDAQSDVLLERGHGPIEAFCETVEEDTQSLSPLVGRNGMAHMFQNCSKTAQIGANHWRKQFYPEIRAKMEECYKGILEGEHVDRVFSFDDSQESKKQMAEELDDMEESVLWKTGELVRSLR